VIELAYQEIDINLFRMLDQKGRGYRKRRGSFDRCQCFSTDSVGFASDILAGHASVHLNLRSSALGKALDLLQEETMPAGYENNRSLPKPKGRRTKL